jgi:diadenosine tetraphosphate (Ap4A) HIT family hydrolase
MSEAQYDPDCYSCQALQGLRLLTNTPRLYTGRFWVVEHAFPTAVRGWLVLVLKRHCRALHQLTDVEFDEFRQILSCAVQALHAELGSEKEYVMQFAESPAFEHVHFHVVPRLPEWPADWRGPNVFQALGEDLAKPLGSTDLARLVQALQLAFEQQLT